MSLRHSATLALLPAVLLTACTTTTTTTRTWGDPYGGGERRGYVTSVRETVRRHDGNPGAGAAFGALVGGLIGSTIGGHAHYDRWGYVHRSPSVAGAMVGAVGGAVVGAAASQGSAEQRTYEVYVRFDDGGAETFVYEGYLPFQVGDPVVLTRGGLART